MGRYFSRQKIAADLPLGKYEIMISFSAAVGDFPEPQNIRDAQAGRRGRFPAPEHFMNHLQDADQEEEL